MILLPEEDVDYNGNKGMFIAQKQNFTHSILIKKSD